MIIILPSANLGLETLLRNIAGTDIMHILNQLSYSYRQLVDLRMPKFSIQTSYSLVDTMIKVITFRLL